MNYSSAQRLFGKSVEELYKTKFGELPCICKESLEMLRQRGMQKQGLFRGHADAKKLQLIRRAWDKGQNPLRLAGVQDCYTVAESLLQWLKALPAPVMPCRLFAAFTRVQLTCSPTQCLHELHFLFNQMEEWDLQLLDHLLGFLHDYREEQRKCGFFTPDLGAIFGPHLLRAHAGPLPLPFPEDLQAAARLIDHLIADYNIIFRPARSLPASPDKKPPPRAKRQHSALQRELHGMDRSPSASPRTPLKRPQYAAARMVSAAHAPTHLRVNIVAHQEEPEATPSDEPDDSQSWSTFFPSAPAHTAKLLSHDEKVGLKTVPELESLDNDKDIDLDMVVGDLMSHSLGKTLFEPDDSAFLQRTTSLISLPSINASYIPSDVSEVSSDDDMHTFSLDCPQNDSRSKQEGPDISPGFKTGTLLQPVRT